MASKYGQVWIWLEFRPPSPNLALEPQPRLRKARRREAPMLKHSLAILAITSIPAMAADGVVSSHDVRFDQVSFTCGEMNQGRQGRALHSFEPRRKNTSKRSNLRRMTRWLRAGISPIGLSAKVAISSRLQLMQAAKALSARRNRLDVEQILSATSRSLEMGLSLL